MPNAAPAAEASTAEPALAWLRPVLGALRPRFAELAGASFLTNLLGLAVPVFVLQVYDRVVFFGTMSTLTGLTAGVAVAIAFDFVLRQMRARALQRIAVRLDAQVARRLFGKLADLPLRTLERQTDADWESLRRDVVAVRDALGGPPLLHALDLPFALVFVAFVGIVAAPTLPVLLVAVGTFAVLGVVCARMVSRATLAEAAAGLARDALQTELVSARTTVKALDAGHRLQTVLEDRHAGAVEGALRRGALSDGFGNAATALAMLTTVAMTVAGALAILAQEMTIGSLIAANMLASRATAPFGQLVPSWRAWTRFRQAGNRLGVLFALAGERAATGIDYPRPTGECAAERVSFHFDATREPTIADVSLSFERGLHCIVGPSGAGKSTLLKLLQGLYAPRVGRVLLDGADIAQFSRSDLARWIGYVPQDFALVAGSIRDNIAGFDPDVPGDAVMAAAKLAGAHGHIADLPDGYASDVGERGRRLSGGQRQRIAVARALVREPPLLLLDEPTAHLDRAAENALCRLLERLARTSTVVAVTHSPRLLAACGNMVLLRQGRVTAAGPPAEIAPGAFPPPPSAVAVGGAA